MEDLGQLSPKQRFKQTIGEHPKNVLQEIGSNLMHKDTLHNSIEDGMIQEIFINKLLFNYHIQHVTYLHGIFIY